MNVILTAILKKKDRAPSHAFIYICVCDSFKEFGEINIELPPCYLIMFCE